MWNASFSVGYSIIKKVHHWTTWDMNYTLITARNSLYSTLGHNCWVLMNFPVRFWEHPDKHYQNKPGNWLMTRSQREQIIQNSNRFNVNSLGSKIVFIIEGLGFAVMWSQNACYLFDCHSRDINGFLSAIGNSVLLKLGSIYEVQEY